MNIRVTGGQVLSGEITPSGSKNSIVALIPASILFDGVITFKNVPEIKDVERLIQIMQKLGSKVNWNKEGKTLVIDNKKLSFDNLDREDLGSMRGTALFWGPMLPRFGKVEFDELPGGCTLGVRPLNPHYEAFRALGVKVKEGDCGVKMNMSRAAPTEIWLTEMSPTVTENVIMLATSLKGKTRIIGAASEPQVQDLCQFLVKAGARITGIGSSILEIEGGRVLHPIEHSVAPDHYEVATFLALSAATGGGIKIRNAASSLFSQIGYVFGKFGVSLERRGETIFLSPKQNIIIKDGINSVLTVKAQPWPGLPVDLLPIFIPLALKAPKGQVLFHNWMYEAGLFWTSELTKMGANIIMCDPHRVIVTAGNKLRGAKLEAPYVIRAVVAMVMAAMIAKGDSEILNADALYRGHPHFSENLRKLGAKIEEVG